MCYWTSQGFGSGHALQAVLERSFPHVQVATPFANGARFSIQGEAPIIAFVSALFKWGGPSAVVRLVALIVIRTFKRMAERWSRPHISQKSSELVPFWTDANTSTAITSEAVRVGIFASLDHHLPHGELACFGATVSGDALSVQTPARHRATCSERVAKDCDIVAAVTSTLPFRLSVIACASAAPDGQSAESLTRQVDKWWHVPIVNHHVAFAGK